MGTIPDANLGGYYVEEDTGVVHYDKYTYYVPPVGPNGVPNLTPGLWSTAQTTAAELNAAAWNTEDLQQTLAAEGSVIPLIFGERPDVGALVFYIATYNGDLVVGCIWGQGEIQAIDAIYMDDVALPGGVTHTPYLGTPTQTVDATLAAATPGFNDAMVGTAYSVFVVPPGLSSGYPRFTAKIRGLKIPTASGGGSVAYTDNPAYILASLVESTVWGMGATADWTSVAAVASACNTLVGGEKKRILNLTIPDARTCADWINVVREYAGCWVVPENGLFRFIPDTTGSSVKSFTTANIAAGSIEIEVRGTRETPTMVEITYTDITSVPARSNPVTEPPSATPRRVSGISMPGFTRYSEARRYAIERKNKATLNDMTIRFVAFDETLELMVGELFDVTHPIGLSAKVFRASLIEAIEEGRWKITGTEYDPAVYSSEVVSDPTVLNTDWADPSAPPAVGTVTLAEEVYQLENGIYASRIRATWPSGATWPFLSRYRVTVLSGGSVIDTSTAEKASTSYATPPVREGVQYQVNVQIVSTTGAVGSVSSSTITPSGKSLIPGDVPSFTGFEAGGKVFLYWTPSVDLDIWRYEIRYGLSSGSWATATLIDQVDTLSLVVNGIPAGDWRFYIKAIDSVRQYSTNAKTLDLTVTLDAAAFLLGTKVFDTIGSPTLTSMTAYTARPDTKTYYVTDFGDALSYGHGDADNVGTFNSAGLASTAFAHPHTAGTSKYVTAIWDMGQDITGNFTGSIVYSNISGTANYWVETATAAAYPTFTQNAGGSAKTTARYVRLRLETTGTMLVESGSSVRVDAYPREENGTVTTSASAAATVTLSYKYAAAKSIQLTPKGTVSRQAVYDNIVLSLSGANSFDVYAFNSAGAQISCDVSWLFQGI